MGPGIRLEVDRSTLLGPAVGVRHLNEFPKKKKKTYVIQFKGKRTTVSNGMLIAYLPSLKSYNIGETISNEMFSFPKKTILIFLVFMCNTSMSYSFGILSQTPTKAEKKGWKLEEEEAERVRAGQQAKGVKGEKIV